MVVFLKLFLVLVVILGTHCNPGPNVQPILPLAAHSPQALDEPQNDFHRVKKATQILKQQAVSFPEYPRFLS